MKKNNFVLNLVFVLAVVFTASACSSDNKSLEFNLEKTVAEIIKKFDIPDIQVSYIISLLEDVGFDKDKRHDDIDAEFLEVEIASLMDSVINDNLGLSEVNQYLYQKFTSGGLDLGEIYVFYHLLKLNIQVESNMSGQ